MKKQQPSLTRTIASLCFLFALQFCQAQLTTESADEDYPKNFTFLTVGSFPNFYEGLPLQLNYERLLIYNKYKAITTILVRLGAGYKLEEVTPGLDRHVLAGITTLTGSGKSHFEMGLGYAHLRDHFGQENRMTYSFGYRYHKRNDILFRIGIGFPERIYISIGLGF